LTRVATLHDALIFTSHLFVNALRPTPSPQIIKSRAASESG
jgi:hypothetical protein